MKASITKRLVVGAAVGGLALTLAACGGSSSSAPAPAGSDTGSAAPADLKPVKLQLQWFTQGQFAGYFAAVDQGFYKDEGLDVEILEGGVDIVPQTVLAQGNADYAITWVPKALASREQGAGITDVAQMLQRSGTLQVSFKDKNLTDAASLKGHTVGNWGFGNEYEIFAGLTKANLDPAKDVNLVGQQFDMVGLLKGDIDAAEAMTYNEYAQVLEAVNPKTGELYQPEDFNVISWEDEGVGMLQDSIWANTDKLENDTDYQDTTVKFIKGSIKGWAYCATNVEKCRDMVVAKGSKLGASHQLWQVNEMNKLIWPAPNGVGVIDEAAWNRTVDLAMNTKNLEGATVLTQKPEGLAYTNDYVNKALEELRAEGIDVTGENYQPITVTLKKGGA